MSAKFQARLLNVVQRLLTILLIPSFKIGTLKLIKIPNSKSANIVGWVKRSAPNKTIMMGSLRLTHPTLTVIAERD